MGCGPSTGPYPATIPASAPLPRSLAALDQKDAADVQQAVDMVARAFAGTATAAAPAEVSDCQVERVWGDAHLRIFVSHAPMRTRAPSLWLRVSVPM